MNEMDLLDLIGEANDTYIQDAKYKEHSTPPRVPHWLKWSVSIAACLTLVIGSTFMLNQSTNPNEEALSKGDGSGHAKGTEFMNYSGPVFPLTFHENNPGLWVSRNIQFDFAKEETERIDTYHPSYTDDRIQIYDTYQIENSTSEDITLTGIYPIVGNFQTKKWPDISSAFGNTQVDVDYTLHAGTYAGGFTGDYGGNETTSSWNLKPFTSWQEYDTLLADETYFNHAFAEAEVLKTPVTVYKLSDLTEGEIKQDAATLCMSFQYDAELTTIMTYGFNGAGTLENGEEYRSFFIREGLNSADAGTKYFIAAGKDIEHYTLQGYKDGSCSPDEKLNAASATVTRIETTIGEILQEITQLRYNSVYEANYNGDYNDYINEIIPYELYNQAVLKHFASYSPIGTEPKDRYAFGLDDIINETIVMDRIFYLTFDFTIPANDTIVLEIKQTKEGSYDYSCETANDYEIYGYDMVTTLGSNIIFDHQTASICNYDSIEIIRQNFGFDLPNDVTSVVLDTNIPHYYLEVRNLLP